MQLDMHFYGVYAMARAAGLKPETARTIAYASQFVDDAIDDDHVLIANSHAIVPTITSHKPVDYQNAVPGDQWKIWVPFHFLPGNDPNAGTFLERMVCVPDSRPANQMLLDAIDEKNKPYWPHLIGIVAHVYADTFSHFGFVGFADAWNRVNEQHIQFVNVNKKSGPFQYLWGKFEEFKTRFLSPLAELIPVGHGAAGTFPDRPYLAWNFKYETHSAKPTYINRNNTDYFLKACKRLHGYFHKFAVAESGDAKIKPNRTWNSIQDAVRALLERQLPKDERIAHWKRAIAEGVFCQATEADKTVRYDETRWQPKNVANDRGPDQDVMDTDVCKFIRAAWRHRNYVLHELLPKFDLIMP
ncbi:MAG: hypothetical protein LJE96_03010 [Deltaproteobacteria bacterium]|nr:hypothetical protein [Deltaproteobacteria bacterium]